MLLSGELNIKQFWFCAPVGVIPPDEVPEGFGLMEFFIEGNMNPDIRIRAKNLSNYKIPPQRKMWLADKILWKYKKEIAGPQ